jgi:DNA-binding MarR family transcriptional regulator
MIGPEESSEIEAALEKLDFEELRSLRELFAEGVRAQYKLDELERRLAGIKVGGNFHVGSETPGWRRSIKVREEAKATRMITHLIEKDYVRRQEIENKRRQDAMSRLTAEDLKFASRDELELMDKILTDPFDSHASRLRILQFISKLIRNPRPAPAWKKWPNVPENQVDAVFFGNVQSLIKEARQNLVAREEKKSSEGRQLPRGLKS